ncbi:uncharacterized protein EV422DRAFT_536306 [Fimicolochytrium jonesii]|uniref:uncharacterized protein n=1 Tax=Fimicolochytrium jonesii TaxID=1396493 RepID=UPI0022FDEE85|nr:uncharacterized protein EV422DRAFT_536306 [Fimicolochytrium jonesii]KAI8819006.1 hypothetical protein EV422DRAFT_536306 [Fimicolochytrium jonesii]
MGQRGRPRGSKNGPNAKKTGPKPKKRSDDPNDDGTGDMSATSHNGEGASDTGALSSLLPPAKRFRTGLGDDGDAHTHPSFAALVGGLHGDALAALTASLKAKAEAGLKPDAAALVSSLLLRQQRAGSGMVGFGGLGGIGVAGSPSTTGAAGPTTSDFVDQLFDRVARKRAAEANNPDPIRFYELSVDPGKSLAVFSPNTWKTRMGMLHKGVTFETVPLSVLGFRTDLAKESGLSKITAPAIRLPNSHTSGNAVANDASNPAARTTFLYDSFRIAEWLDTAYPDAPSLFTGDGKPTRGAHQPHITTGKAFARLIDLGLGASDPQWAVWFDLFFPELYALHSASSVPGLLDYFASDARLGLNGAHRLLSLDRAELTARAKLTVLPLIQILKERPGEYIQGKWPGQADYVVFGRYAFCRTLNKQLCREIWEDQAPELEAWVERLCKAYGGHAQKVFEAYEMQVEQQRVEVEQQQQGLFDHHHQHHPHHQLGSEEVGQDHEQHHQHPPAAVAGIGS